MLLGLGAGWGGYRKLQGEEEGDKAEEQKLGRQQREGVEEKAVESSKEQAIGKGLGRELPGPSRLPDVYHHPVQETETSSRGKA